MSERKRRFLERASPRVQTHGSPAPTIVGADCVFIGNIRGRGPFVVSGEVHGDGDLDGALILSASASWYGDVAAYQAIIAGKFIGRLAVADKLEIGCGAVIRGGVSARIITIAEGAIVDGDIEVTSEIPVIRFAEKRDLGRDC